MTSPAREIQEAAGSAFPLPTKMLATALVAGTLLGGVQALPQLMATSWQFSAAALVVLALVLVAWCLYWIWFSRSAIDARGIHQTWMWDKHVGWDEVVQARLIGVPYLEWLIAPRLAVRAKGRGVVIFHVADRQVLQGLAVFVSTGVPPARSARIAPAPCP
jgi:hypothetical protein